jgi:hypothetical protein
MYLGTFYCLRGTTTVVLLSSSLVAAQVGKRRWAHRCSLWLPWANRPFAMTRNRITKAESTPVPFSSNGFPKFVPLAETLSKMNSKHQGLSKRALLAYAPSTLISLSTHQRSTCSERRFVLASEEGRDGGRSYSKWLANKSHPRTNTH